MHLRSEPPDRIGVHYDLARLIKVMTIFDMVDLVDQVDELSNEQLRLAVRPNQTKEPEPPTVEEKPRSVDWNKWIGFLSPE